MTLARLWQGLRTINLADNEITRLENLLQLPKLEVLDVSGNRIQHISKFEREHRRLHTVKLAHNRLASLSDVEHLRAVQNLSVLTLAGNPLAAHAHTRPYATFHLRKLDMLDNEAISSAERDEANAVCVCARACVRVCVCIVVIVARAHTHKHTQSQTHLKKKICV